MATDGTNGSDLQQLTNDLTTERGAAWSPDGTQIAFIRDDGTTPGIYSVPATGGTPRAAVCGSRLYEDRLAAAPAKVKALTRSAWAGGWCDGLADPVPGRGAAAC